MKTYAIIYIYDEGIGGGQEVHVVALRKEDLESLFDDCVEHYSDWWPSRRLRRVDVYECAKSFSICHGKKKEG